MAFKKRSEDAVKPTLRRLGRFVRGGEGHSSDPISGHPKRANAVKAAATSAPGAIEVLALTDADITRMDALCEAPTEITDHMRAAIVRHRNMVRT